MKIDDVIEELKLYKEMFGNLDVKLSMGYEIIDTPYRYSKKLIIKDCKVCVSSIINGKDIVLIEGE